MTLRPQPGPAGGWSVEIGKGPTAFGRNNFATAAEAESWSSMAQAALKASTIRIGPKRILGTGAEALRRWAIDQGTLPRDEGGTHLAPLARLQPLIADPACALPLAALLPEDLALLRARRRQALESEAAMLLEQAALAAAIDNLRDLYLPALEQPFHTAAPDGVFLPDDAACARILARSLQQDADLGRAVGLILTTGIAPSLLLAARARQLDREKGTLRWAGFEAAWPGGLEWPGFPPEAPLLGPLAEADLTRDVLRIGLALPALWLAGLGVALREGRHLDEAMALAGLHQPGHR
jgi:hypothetical protein